MNLPRGKLLTDRATSSYPIAEPDLSMKQGQTRRGEISPIPVGAYARFR
jgi:hypothetical protein